MDGIFEKGVNPANLNGTLTDPFGAAMSTYNVDDNLNKQLLDLFPGTIPDEPLQLVMTLFLRMQVLILMTIRV
ncbi:hypothetical protein L3X07_04025 [Levilactobacillus brevis]|nr:hypothetical protein [Levilactobacillus brevis]